MECWEVAQQHSSTIARGKGRAMEAVHTYIYLGEFSPVFRKRETSSKTSCKWSGKSYVTSLLSKHMVRGDGPSLSLINIEVVIKRHWPRPSKKKRYDRSLWHKRSFLWDSFVCRRQKPNSNGRKQEGKLTGSRIWKVQEEIILQAWMDPVIGTVPSFLGSASICAELSLGQVLLLGCLQQNLQFTLPG